MNTDFLIAQLAEDLHPVPPVASRTHLKIGLAAGGAIAMAAVIFWPTLGIRPDLHAALSTGIFWVKLFYTGSLAVLGFRALDRLSKPDMAQVPWAGMLALPFALLAGLTLFWLGTRPDAGDAAFWMGSSWDLCPLYVAGLSVPVFFGLLWSLSRLAPTQLRAAGGAAGLVAGGTAATVYALHCTESSPGFVLLWYSLGLAVASLVGAMVGPRLLRW